VQKFNFCTPQTDYFSAAVICHWLVMVLIELCSSSKFWGQVNQARQPVLLVPKHGLGTSITEKEITYLL
jgi:hypothetical protein